MLRNTLCWVMLAVFPLSLMAADSGAAMLYAKGTTWINGGPVPRSSAIFPGDLVQTKPDSMANINVFGSNVMILPDSLVKFEGDGVAIDRGSVNVATSKGMSTHAENLTVTPASSGWAEFEVSDSDGKVQIIARKGDLNISDGTETSTLSQGQQTTMDQSATKRKRAHGGAAPAAGGGILDSPIVVAVGAAGIGALLTWVALQSSNPSSPAVP